MDDNTRRFSDEEFARILHTALQLQERDTARPPTDRGLTLEDMKAAARDVGIDPALVERAAALLPEKAATGRRLLGGAARYRLSCSLPGPAGPEELARAVDMIQEELGVAGRVASELDGITWETEGELSQIHVTLRPTADSTEVRVAVNRDAAAALTTFLPTVAGVVSAGIAGAILDPATMAEGALIMGSGLVAGLAAARGLWGRSSRVIRHRADRLMDLLQQGLAS